MATSAVALDELDLALLRELHDAPKAGALELSRRLRVARATVLARLRRLEEAGIIAGYEPRIGLAAAGFGVQAFVTLETAQGALDEVRAELESLPSVLEAFVTTGTGDILCRVAASSHQNLQQTLIDLNRSNLVARTTSVMVLSVVVPYRVLPLLETAERGHSSKAPAYRRGE